MKNFADVILAFFDLAEAEGRLLQTRVLHTVRSCLWFALGALFAAAALGFFLASCLDWLLTYISRPAALGLTGLCSAVISVVFLVGSSLCLKIKKEKSHSPANKSRK